MQTRKILSETISNFDLEKIAAFFISISEIFKPDFADYSLYLDSSFSSFSDLKKIGEILFTEAERIIIIAGKSPEKNSAAVPGKNDSTNWPEQFSSLSIMMPGSLYFTTTTVISDSVWW